MITKLSAINTMLSCIKHAPVQTLEGTKNSFTITAENILADVSRFVQSQGWAFNVEENYTLTPDENSLIKVPDDTIQIDFYYNLGTRYTVRENKIYDKLNHTFKIPSPLKACVTFCFDFEKLPETVKYYIQISAAYKFTKRALGSGAVCMYTKEDVDEAYASINRYELEHGNYSILPEIWTGTVRNSI